MISTSSSEFVGNKQALRLLSAAKAKNRASGSWLFTGPPSVGKSTLARWFAALLLCSDETSDHPCGQCIHCRKIYHGSHPDVETISLALQAEQSGKPSREIGIDSIRNIIERIYLRPFEANRKVYLIEDASTMTEEAANAFLKTLEEPPDFVTIVLIAIDDYSLPETIRSRCYRVNLQPVPHSEITRYLVNSLGVEQEEANMIATLSNGRPGWAIRATHDRALVAQVNDDWKYLNKILQSNDIERLKSAEELSKDWSNKPNDRDDLYSLLFNWIGIIRLATIKSFQENGSKAYLSENVDLIRFLSSLGPQHGYELIQQILKAIYMLDSNANVRLVLENLFLKLPRV